MSYYDFNDGRWHDGPAPGSGNYNPQSSPGNIAHPTAVPPPSWTTRSQDFYRFSGRNIFYNPSYAAAQRAYNARKAAEAAAAAERRRVEQATNRQKGIFAGIKNSVSKAFHDQINAAHNTLKAVAGGIKWGATKPIKVWDNYWYEQGLRGQNKKNQGKEQDFENWTANNFQNKTTDALNAADLTFQKSPTQANADAYNNLLEQRKQAANRIYKSFEDWRGDLKPKPIHGGFNKAMSFLTGAAKSVGDFTWKFSLGHGTPKIPSAADAPRRVVDFITGNNPNSKVSSPFYHDPNWSGYNKALHDKTFISNTQLNQNKKQSRWKATYRLGDLQDRGLAESFANDPLTWLGGLGIAKKAGLSAAEKAAPSLARKFGINVGRKVADSKSVQRFTQSPVGKGAEWLLKQKQPRSAELRQQTQKLLAQGAEHGAAAFGKATGKKVGPYFGSLNDQEFRAAQKILLSPKKLPRNVFASKEIDAQKVKDFVASHIKMTETQRAKEAAAGVKYKYAQGYLARPNTGGTKDTEFGFQRRRGALKRSMSRSEAEFAHFQRQMQHLQAVTPKSAKGGFLADYAKQADRHRQKIFESSQASQKAYKGVKESAQRAGSIPTRLWKAAVLPLSGTWVPHNLAWNIWLAGQHGSLPGAFRNLVRRNLRDKKLPDDLFGKSLHEDFAKDSGILHTLYRPGARTENAFRRAMYEKEISRGATKEAALAKVDREFFDYSKLRNVERPLNAAIPFYKWQKNLTRYAFTSPVRHPFGTQAAQAFQKYAIDQPYDLLPDITQPAQYDEEGNITRPEVHKKDIFKDKIHLPWTDLNKKSSWISNAWLPFTRGQLGQTNFNPFIEIGRQLGTGKDRFGRTIEDPMDIPLSQFPQSRVVKSGLAALSKKQYPERKWATPNLNTKVEQGFDPNRSNYNEQLDLAKQFKKSIKSFFGFDSLVFDAPKFREAAKFSQFMQEYLKIPHTSQATTPEQYEAVDKSRHDVASKYGYDLQKDIYDKKFKANDTPETAIRKTKQAATRALQQQVYGVLKEIIARPDYKGKGKDIAQFIEATRRRYLAGGDINLKLTPHPHLFPKAGYAPDGSFGSLKGGSGKHGGIQVRGKWFKSLASAQRYWAFHDRGGRGRSGNAAFWRTYFASSPAKRLDMLNAHLNLSKNHRKVRLAWLYQHLNPDQAKAALLKEGLGGPPLTAAQYQQKRIEKSIKGRQQYAADVAYTPALGTAKQSFVSSLTKSYKPPVGKQSPVRFLTPGQRGKLKHLTV